MQFYIISYHINNIEIYIYKIIIKFIFLIINIKIYQIKFFICHSSAMNFPETY